MTMRSGERNSAGLVARSTRHRFRLRSGVALLALVLHGGACAVATYPGPRRPSSEVALVEARDLAIDEIDGLDVRGKGARFEVLAGDHMMVVHLAKVTRFGPGLPVGSGLVLAGVVTRSGQIPLCVSARPRHSYMLEPKDAGAFGSRSSSTAPPTFGFLPAGRSPLTTATTSPVRARSRRRAWRAAFGR